MKYLIIENKIIGEVNGSVKTSNRVQTVSGKSYSIQGIDDNIALYMGLILIKDKQLPISIILYDNITKLSILFDMSKVLDIILDDLDIFKKSAGNSLLINSHSDMLMPVNKTNDPHNNYEKIVNSWIRDIREDKLNKIL